MPNPSLFSRLNFTLKFFTSPLPVAQVDGEWGLQYVHQKLSLPVLPPHTPPALQWETNFFRMSLSPGLQFFKNYISLYASPLCAILHESATPVWISPQGHMSCKQTFSPQVYRSLSGPFPSWASEHENYFVFLPVDLPSFFCWVSISF